VYGTDKNQKDKLGTWYLTLAFVSFKVAPCTSAIVICVKPRKVLTRDSTGSHGAKKFEIPVIGAQIVFQRVEKGKRRYKEVAKWERKSRISNVLHGTRSSEKGTRRMKTG